jgi:hypothetical protein
MKKKHTAVEWLALELPIGLRKSFIKEIEQALQMEQEQMGGAFISGGLNWENLLTFAEYLKETYGIQDQK